MNGWIPTVVEIALRSFNDPGAKYTEGWEAEVTERENSGLSLEHYYQRKELAVLYEYPKDHYRLLVNNRLLRWLIGSAFSVASPYCHFDGQAWFDWMSDDIQSEVEYHVNYERRTTAQRWTQERNAAIWNLLIEFALRKVT